MKKHCKYTIEKNKIDKNLRIIIIFTNKNNDNSKQMIKIKLNVFIRLKL